MDFDAELGKLPQPVSDHLRAAGLTDASLVADSAAPSSSQDGQGTTINKTVDLVFVEAIAKEVEAVRPATAAWALTMRFFRACWADTHKATTEANAEASPIEAKDVQAEEYYELAPEYRNRRLRELNRARRLEVHDARLPSLRMCGRYERLKRVNHEFEPVQPNKLQTEAASKKRPAAAGMMPASGGVLAWRLPAIDEPPPTTIQQLELDVRGREPAHPDWMGH